MKKILQGLAVTASLILNLRFLPDHLQRWLFSTGTRALEVANVSILVGWAALLYVDGRRMLDLQNYKTFSMLDHKTLASIFAILSLIIFVATLFPNSLKSQLFKGYTMLLSAAVWAIVSTGFAIAYPPLSTAMVVYPVLAVLCWLCGENLIERAKAGL